VTVDGVDKDENRTPSVWVGKFDGKAYPAKEICLGIPPLTR